MVGCNCAGTVHGVNGGTDQRVTCSIANCSAENHISAEAARRAGLDLVALEQQAGLTDILGNTTSADSLARNVRISLLDADGQWVEFVLPTVIVLQTPMNPNCQFTLGQPFFKYRGLSLTAQGMGTRREWNDPDMVWFPEDPQLQEDPNVAYLGISQWQEGTRPKTCTVCGLEFPRPQGLRALRRGGDAAGPAAAVLLARLPAAALAGGAPGLPPGTEYDDRRRARARRPARRRPGRGARLLSGRALGRRGPQPQPVRIH